MRPLILALAILLMSAICSCRSSRQSVSEKVDSLDVRVEKVGSSLSTDDILSIINSQRDIDLSGIKIEFYPPDSTVPDARAAPKSLTVDNASVKEKTDATKHEVALKADKDTVNVRARQSSAQATDTKTAVRISDPVPIVLISLIIFAFIFSIFIFPKLLK